MLAIAMWLRVGVTAAALPSTGTLAMALDFKAGELDANSAPKKCPLVCQWNHARWNGNWAKGDGNNPQSQGDPSVCGCD